MKVSRQDLKRLRVPIAASLLMAVLGAASFIATDRYLDQAKDAREAAKVQRTQAQKRVELVAEEEREIRDNLAYYGKMAERGMTSQENRLDVIDTIARIKTERRIFDVHYNIDPQKPLDYAGITPAGAVDFVTSRVKLEMLLLHEEDLIDFLADLNTSGKAFVSVRHCSIARLDRSTTATSVAPRLRSECQIDLVALKRMAQ